MNNLKTANLSQSEWNELLISFSIYGHPWARNLILPKLKEQGIKIPHWALKEKN